MTSFLNKHHDKSALNTWFASTMKSFPLPHYEALNFHDTADLDNKKIMSAFKSRSDNFDPYKNNEDNVDFDHSNSFTRFETNNSPSFSYDIFQRKESDILIGMNDNYLNLDIPKSYSDNLEFPSSISDIFSQKNTSSTSMLDILNDNYVCTPTLTNMQNTQNLVQENNVYESVADKCIHENILKSQNDTYNSKLDSSQVDETFLAKDLQNDINGTKNSCDPFLLESSKFLESDKDNDNVPWYIKSSIIIYGIPFDWSLVQLHAFFAPYGKILQYRFDTPIPKHRFTKVTYVRAFIQYSTPEAALLAEANTNGYQISKTQTLHVILKQNHLKKQHSIGNHLKAPLNETLDTNKKIGIKPQQFNEQKQFSNKALIPKNNIFVFHVPPNWNEQTFYNCFSVFGHIRSYVLPKSNTPWGHRGYGFVCYEFTESAQEAIYCMNNKEVEIGRRLAVQLKQPRITKTKCFPASSDEISTDITKEKLEIYNLINMLKAKLKPDELDNYLNATKKNPIQNADEF